MDLEPFERINPCGYQGMRVTSMAKLLPRRRLDMTAVGKQLLGNVIAMLPRVAD